MHIALKTCLLTPLTYSSSDVTVSLILFTRLDQFTARFGIDLIVGELLIDVQCVGGRTSIPRYGTALQRGYLGPPRNRLLGCSKQVCLRNLARDPESVEHRVARKARKHCLGVDLATYLRASPRLVYPGSGSVMISERCL